jgi:hypothetical protein
MENINKKPTAGYSPARHLVTSFLFLLLIWPVLHAAETGNLVAVMDLTSDGSVSPSAIDSLCDIICQSISSNILYEVFDRKFLPFTLQSLGRPEHPRCSETPCLIDIGRDIGAKYMIGGSIKKVKTDYIIHLNLINSESKISIGTVSKRARVSKIAFIKQKLPSLVNELLVLNNQQVNIDKAPYAAANKPAPAIITQPPANITGKQPETEKQFIVKTEAGTPQSQQLVIPEEMGDINKKPGLESEKPGVAESDKNKKKHSPLMLIGTSAVAVGAAAVVFYFKFMEGPSSDGENDLSLEDAPNHVK